MIQAIKDFKLDFPFFKTKDVVYLDSGATAQKPYAVFDAVKAYEQQSCANIHRSLHGGANAATTLYEDARKKVAHFVGTQTPDDILFVRNATEGINLVAHSFAKEQVDAIIISSLEHHSNIVPWQLIGKPLYVVKTHADLSLDMEDLRRLVKEHPNALVAITHVSNAFGIVHPIDEIARIAHEGDCYVLVDAAQSAPHFPLHVKQSKVDFLVLSAHKLYGPTGIGALYVAPRLQLKLLPYQGGGGMIEEVSFERSTFLPYPHGFEAGTPNISGAVGFGAAVDYLDSIGLERIREHEMGLVDVALGALKERGDVLLYTDRIDTGIISFNVRGTHPSDIGILLDKQKVQVRTGHHCAQPAMKMLGIAGTVRISFGIYNDEVDVVKFLAALDKCIRILQ